MNLNLSSAHIGKRIRFKGDPGGSSTVKLYETPFGDNAVWPNGTYFEIYNGFTAGNGNDLVIQPQPNVTVNQIHGTLTIQPGEYARIYLAEEGLGVVWDVALFKAAADPTPATAAPDTELVFGTGTAVSSSSHLTYDAITGSLNLNANNFEVPDPGNLTLSAPHADGTSSANGGSIYVWAGNQANGGQGGEVIIRSGASNQGIASVSELLLSSTTGDDTASDVYLKAGHATAGRQGGIIDLTAGNTDAGGQGGYIALSAGNSSGGTSVFAGNVAISAGSISGTGVDGTGGNVTINAGTVSADNSGAYTNGQGGHLYLSAGPIMGKANFTGTVSGGNIVLTPGYTDTNDAANGGSIIFALNNGTMNHGITSFGAIVLNNNVGQPGQVIKSDGPTGTAYWADASSNVPTFVYSLSMNGTGSFSGSLFGSWTTERRDQEIVNTVSVDSNTGAFVINDTGLYEVFVTVRFGASGVSLPDGLMAYGFAWETNNGGSIIGESSSQHTTYSDPSFPNSNSALSDASAAVAQLAGSVRTFNDRFLVVSGGASTFSPFAYSYTYNGDGNEPTFNVIVTFKRLG